MKPVWDAIVGILAVLGLLSLPVIALMLFLAYRLFSRMGSQFLHQNGSVLDLMARHTSIDSKTAEQLTDRLEKKIEGTPKRTVSEFLRLQEKASLSDNLIALPAAPHHPAPTPGEGRTDPNAPPTAGPVPRSIFIGALMLLGVGAPAVAWKEDKCMAMDGHEAMALGDYKAAVHAFRESGDQHRLAEALHFDGKDTEASKICTKLGNKDYRAVYILGLIAKKKGDTARAKELFQKAKDLGSPSAPYQLARM